MTRVSSRVRRHGDTLARFTLYALRRFIADGCLTGAGALSYTTLVSLVPLVAIVTAIFSAFPIFSEERQRFLGVLMQYFVPAVGQEAAYWFSYFAQIAARTTAVGVVALVVTSILLLVTIEDQLHAIWRVRTARPWLQRILIYWALLTLGPILTGMSLSLSTYFETAAATAGFDPAALEQAAAPWLHRVAQIVPFLLEAVTCTLVYALIPNCTVRWREALVGGLVAAVAIELLKIGFALYIARISSYQTIYGAVAAIPIFLLWMYISWAAVLFGAVVSAALPQWRVDLGEKRVTAEGRHLGVCLALLAELEESARDGGTRASPELALRLDLAASAVDDHLAPLQKASFVAATTDGGWVLARALASATLADLYRALDLPVAGGWRIRDAETAWQRRVLPAMKRVAAAEDAAMRIPLAELLDAPGTARPHSTPIDLHRRRT
ncbi:MAG: YihY family inner membrane protein [Alphaproteobacteria bacterium]|nr:YihY family inner membrane protein [Alphaproteobacteria bacterium]